MDSKAVIERLESEGWVEIPPRTFRSHRHYRHPSRPGKVTVPALDVIPDFTLKLIGEQAGIDFPLGDMVMVDEQ